MSDSAIIRVGIMNKLKSLEDVNALALPANVLVLLSKYAKVLRAKNGTIIKLSSLRIFFHVHQTCLKAKDTELNIIYHQLLDEVNDHIARGTMFTNEEKELSLDKNKEKKPNSRLSKKQNDASTRI